MPLANLRAQMLSAISSRPRLPGNQSGDTTGTPVVSPLGPLIPGAAPINSPTPTANRGSNCLHDVLNSPRGPILKWRTANPGDITQPWQDVTMRLSSTNTAVDNVNSGRYHHIPGVLFYSLSDGLPVSWWSHRDHYDLLSYPPSLDLSVSHAVAAFIPLH